MITKEQLKSHELWLEGDSSGQRIVLLGAKLIRADLRKADLREADLREAKLIGADLREADLREAKLIGADLSGADLRGADLFGADLREASLIGADLSEAKLIGADLREADLRGAVGLPIADDAPARLLAVARAALRPGGLKMDDWHTCKTTHCMSGWAITQAGEVGRLLESVVGSHLAGLYLLGAEAALHFYDSDEDATQYLRSVIAVADKQKGQDHE